MMGDQTHLKQYNLKCLTNVILGVGCDFLLSVNIEPGTTLLSLNCRTKVGKKSFSCSLDFILQTPYLQFQPQS